MDSHIETKKPGKIVISGLSFLAILFISGCSMNPPMKVGIEPQSDYARGWAEGEIYATGNPMWIVSGVGCGGFAPLFAYILPITSSSQNIFTGKTPEYMTGFVDGYKAKTRVKNVNYALAGWGLWVVFYVVYLSSESK